MSDSSPKSNPTSKIIPILTGAVSLLLGIGYLLLVEFLDSRGEMLPAPPMSIVLGYLQNHGFFDLGL